MEAWLKQAVVEKSDVCPPPAQSRAKHGESSSVSRAKYAMQVAINLFVDIVDRREGSGFAEKFHQKLHLLVICMVLKQPSTRQCCF
jgi:hypothetical protein